MQYYNTNALSNPGAKVGTVIKLDKNTEAIIRGKFAHQCAELDLSTPLVPTIMVGKHRQVVECEGIHLV